VKRERRAGSPAGPNRPPGDSPFRAILFDWDGTLADTAEASYRCYVRMFAEFGILFDRAEFERTYSPDWYHTFRCVGLPEGQWAAADAKWLAYFAQEMIELAPDVHRVLDLLDSHGLRKAIVTSGSRDRVHRELTAHRIIHRFDHVVCGNDVAERKPHPAALQLCLERLGIAAQEAAYVGDSPEDVLMARAANVFAVAVRGAYPNGEALVRSEPDLLAPSLADAVASIV
jgi:HAD superfamily hydrolase (TIGR01549 family)